MYKSSQNRSELELNVAALLEGLRARTAQRPQSPEKNLPNDVIMSRYQTAAVVFWTTVAQ